MGRETGRGSRGGHFGHGLHGRLLFGHEAHRLEDEQNLQRPAPALFGTPLRAGRIQPAGPSARFVDHARQGQSGDSRSDEPDRLQGHRQRTLRDDGRRSCADGAERHGAGDGPVLFRVRRTACQRFRHAAHPLCRGHHGQRGEMPAVRAQQYRRGDGAQSDHRVQEFDENRQGGAGNRARRLRAGARTRHPEPRGAGRGAEARKHDPSRKTEYQAAALEIFLYFWNSFPIPL